MWYDTEIRRPIIERTVSWATQFTAFAGVPAGIGVCLLLAVCGGNDFETIMLFGHVTVGLFGLTGAAIGLWSALVSETPEPDAKANRAFDRRNPRTNHFLSVVYQTVSWGAQFLAFAGLVAGVGVSALIALGMNETTTATVGFGAAGVIGLLGATLGLWSALVKETLRRQNLPEPATPNARK